MPEFISIQTHKAIYLCASHDIARNANESLIVLSSLCLLCPNCSISPPTQGWGHPGWHRMEAELGECCQGRTGRKHSPRSTVGEIPAGGTPARIPNLTLPFASCSQHRQEPAKSHLQPSPNAGAAALLAAGSSIPQQGKQSHFRAPLAEGAAGRNAPRSSPGRAERLPRLRVAKKITI